MVPKDLNIGNSRVWWRFFQGQIYNPWSRGFAAVGFAAIAFTQLHVVAGGDTWDETSWSTSAMKAVTTNSLPQKIDGWKVKFPVKMAPFKDMFNFLGGGNL